MMNWLFQQMIWLLQQWYILLPVAVIVGGLWAFFDRPTNDSQAGWVKEAIQSKKKALTGKIRPASLFYLTNLAQMLGICYTSLRIACLPAGRLSTN